MCATVDSQCLEYLGYITLRLRRDATHCTVLQAFMNSESLCFFDLHPIFDVFKYFLFLKSWLWHSISIGNEICNTYKSCLKLLLPCCCLDKQKRQVHQKIAGLSLNQLFMNLRIHCFIYFFDAYFKKKSWQKNKQILYMHPF